MSENIRREGVEDVLQAVRRNAQELGARAARWPTAVRVRAGDVVVEMEWTADDRIGTIEIAALGELATASAIRAQHLDNPDLLHDICAPTLGVFFRSPQPGAPPFVVEGDVVEAGQQVAVLETMKIMIPVEADRRGRVFAVMKGDSEPVEYGEPLFSVEPLD